MTPERELCWIWYCSLERMTPLFKARLLKQAGGPEVLYGAGEKALRELASPIFQGRDLEGFLTFLGESRREQEQRDRREQMKRLGIRLVSMEDPEFPGCLLPYEDCPAGLFAAGRLPCMDKPAAALVGARNCTFYGRKLAMELGRDLAEAGIQIVSGLARGIDAAAHEGALAGGGETFGILGCGPDVVYPRENRHLYEQVRESGGLISEYPPGAKPLAFHFPARNRLISGLSSCTAVVEAGERSGALITASIALEQGKEVFAMPGRPGDRLSAGTNGLLRDGAHILTSAADLLSLWNIKKPLRFSKKQKLSLDKNLEKVYICLDSGLKSTSMLCAETGLRPEETAACLVDLEIQGLIERPFGDYYTAKRNEGEHHGKVSGHRGVPCKGKDH